MMVESVHGTVRAKFLVPRIGAFRSGQLGVPVGSGLVFAVTYVSIRWIGTRDTSSLLQLGLLWVILTLIFEFGLGHYVFHRSWRDLGSDYNLANGGLMPIGLLVLTFAPLGAARLRHL